MPSIRIGFSTDFNLTGEQVGIGTTFPSARLDVRGQILSDNSAGSGGVSTITRYDGFLNKEQRLADNVSIGQTTKGNLNSISGEIVIPSGKEITVSSGTPIAAGRLDSLTVTNAFDLPHGGTLEREETPEKGSTRFNQDLGQLEFYTGTEWRTAASYDGSGRGRVVIFAGNNGGSAQSVIQYFNAATQGNAINFGSASAIANACGGVSDSTRGVFNNGYNTPTTTLEYVTIASEGNSISFGSLSVARYRGSSHSSSTRGLFLGGRNYPGGTSTNIIDYIQIQTLGNAIDFGDLYKIHSGQSSGMGSPTRAFTMGGYASSPGTYYNDIQVVTISSKGDAVNFGTLTYAGGYLSACSNSIRGFGSGGYQFPGSTTTRHINTLTLSTQGNATSFGDLTSNRGYAAGSSSNTRGFYIGGFSNPGSTTYTNTIEFWNISTSGNAIDFGDQVNTLYDQGACSDSHGGLGGF